MGEYAHHLDAVRVYENCECQGWTERFEIRNLAGEVVASPVARSNHLRDCPKNTKAAEDRFQREEIRRAKAEGWDEGYATGQVDHECAAENPYREENADG